MNIQNRFGGIWRLLRGTLSQQGSDDETGGFFAPESGYGVAGSLWRGLSGRSLELAEVQQEVAAEMHGQVLVIGRHDEANRGLLARLRGQPAVPPGGPVYREGFFALATLPAGQPEERGAGDDAGSLSLAEISSLVSEADALLYVFVESHGWRAADARWYARLRAAGTPLTLVAVDPPPDSLPAQVANLRYMEGEMRAALPAGERPVEVGLTTPEPPVDETPADVIALVERILAQRQRLAIPLAQEIPGCRPMIAERTIRSGMLMAALLGAEPIPLLDLPLQVTLNWRMALQLAAIYGHTGLDYRSRELIGTVAWNLGLRYLIQQALKLVPVLGWAASAALSGGGAWLFGHVLRRHYEADGGWPMADGIGQIANGTLQIANGTLQIASRKWQGARRKSHAVMAGLRKRMAQGRQSKLPTCATGGYDGR